MWRSQIAAGVIMGLKIAHVARELGVSRSWASREANSPGVRNIIAELIWAHREKIKELLMLSAKAIEGALDARNEYVCTGEFWKVVLTITRGWTQLTRS